IYSIATSSVVRTIQPITNAHSKVTCHRISSSNENHLYISSSSGEVSLWDWTSGKKITSFKHEGATIGLAISSTSSGADAVQDVAFSLNTLPSGSASIHAAVLCDTKRPSCKTILRSDKALNFIQAASDGKTVIAAGGDQLIVGYTAHNAVDDFDNLRYSWLELQLPVSVTCMDVRDEHNEAVSKKSAKFKPVDLVLGDKGGVILLYRDLVGSLLRMAKDHKAKLNPSRFHWHRFAVKALRWSRDGNYLISGGLEQVLVLWQLDSGRKQFLPHLSSHICSLAVSHHGDAYAIKLADNSAMVLSTAEMRPIANVSGLQVTSPSREKHLPPSVLHPVHSEQLLVAVASAPTVSSTVAPSNSFLQTFDTRSGRHISRQALTRTNVTVHATGPDGTELTTPDVTHMQITSDAEWLATVDEWSLYKQEASVCHPAVLQTEDRREVSLKFWHWNESSRGWDLNTRVESPHFSVNAGSTSVFGVAVNPEVAMFATIGGDSTLRVWTPRIRSRQKQKAHNIQDHPHPVTWKCHRNVALEKAIVPAKRARLNFSPDGSVLAVSWSDRKGKGIAHLINPYTGEICHSRYGLYAGDIQSLGFVNRYLVILCDRLLIWDIVADKTESASIHTAGDSSGSKVYPDLLAVNSNGNNYAVVINGYKGSTSRLMIFSPQSFVPLFQTTFDHECSSLLLNANSSSYLVVDSTSRITRISSHWEKAVTDKFVDSSLSLDTRKARPGLQNMLGQFPAADDQYVKMADVGGQQDHRVSEKGLASILDVGPSFVYSGVQQLFRNVVKHFAA
ncbi:hypothetical protein KEM54_000166, partial [Ascosphaera aggregata]